MKRVWVFLFTALAGSNLMAATLHVDINSTNSIVPYSSRETAATNIQTAVNAAVAGDTVQVWDGHYRLASEITVSKAITIQSGSGPDTTIVDGQGIVRCFNLGNRACVVEGLTITNGYSSGNGGGIYCSGILPVVTNCTISGNTATQYGGGMHWGTVNNCTISGNTATQYGGGVSRGTANHCTIVGNTTNLGGGMFDGTANNCTISGNSAYSGGGMRSGSANNCTITGNSAEYGGGMYDGTANNCTLSGNTATEYGGGMRSGTANNCTISGNSAEYGGGMYDGTANNCTISGNTTTLYVGGGMYYGTANNCTITGNRGGGIYRGTAYNCIVWYSTTGKDLSDRTTVSYSCSPDVTHGSNGNITNAPVLVSSSHIAADSPCRGAGSADYASGTDIDGEAWANPPSMGCDEPADFPGGPLTVGFVANETMVVSGYPIQFREQIHGALSKHVWNFGDGVQVTNSLSVEHAWTTLGTYDVVLTAYNADWPGGVSTTQEVRIALIEDLPIYVSPDGNDANDGRSWASAKATIQSGLNAQRLPGGWVLVGSGTYSLSATITVSKPVHIVSADGSETTIVNGQGSVRCFSLGNNACVIEGLTITNGYADYGGGIYCFGNVPVVTNCLITGNRAYYGGGMYYGTANNCTISGNSASNDGGGIRGVVANNCTITGNSASNDGGGMVGGTANNCTISGNSAARYGGGMSGGTANNCTITENSASFGGGMYNGTANNSIVWCNTASSGKDLSSTTAKFSCSPDVTHGVDGNMTNAPVLVSSSHIAADSPCYGAGSAEYATGTDIDGEAWANRPSIGCDEPADSPIGPIEVGFVANETMVFPGYPIQFREQIHGARSAHVWDFGDGTRVTNSTSVEHAWASLGTYHVVLTAYNADWPGGVSTTQEVWIALIEDLPIYVSPDGNDANDGRSWASAKATIQSGVNAQGLPGGWVLVGSGTYSLSATITVSKPVRIVSVDGSETTIVNGQGSVRCFSLGNNDCVIEGLTITNGYAEYGGGIYCSGNVPVVTNCLITGNRAYCGGGMYYGTANNCTISGNSASNDGGGISGVVANNCTITGNSASDRGGGMSGRTANNCTISGNSADYGGGVSDGTLNHCTISGNTASSGGGGMYYGTANNCTISGNMASYEGGGMLGGTANNCTISGNSAGWHGGGMDGGTANNCIVWYNTAPSGKDLYDVTATYSCSPDVTHGVDGNITNAPVFLSSSHIAADSPCRGAGSADYAAGTDIDGEAWANPPSMGCDEPSDDLPRGAIAVDFVASESMVASGYPVRFWEQIHGSLSAHVWDFGDGTRVTNSPFVEHAWAGAGTYDVVLTAYNADWPDGVSATQEVSIVSFEETAIHVSPNGNDANDGTSWASAKKTIQAGVDAQVFLGGGVLVGSGTYSLSETITVLEPVRIVSVDGPRSTIVDGNGSVRCFILGNIACVIEGLTVTNGYSSSDGGGICCLDATPVVTNCFITGNRAYYGGGMYGGTANNCTISGNSASDYGGGMSEGTANHCTISGNSASNYAGGMYGGTANHCTISGNMASYEGGGVLFGTANHCTISGNTAGEYGGGMDWCTANNCIVWYNTAPSGKDLYETTASYSCSPDVVNGVNGNITNAPVFVDAANGNYRLSPNSPCINMGDNAVVVGSVDLDGLPRIAGGLVDMGAYEYQGAGIGDQDCDGLPDNWEVDYFDDTSSMRSSDDSDMDLIDNWSEWIAGTNPSDPNSAFVVSVSTNQIPTGFVIEWTSVEDRSYFVLWRGSLTNAHEVLEEGIEYPQNSYTDTLHNAESTGFYQIGVQLK